MKNERIIRKQFVSDPYELETATAKDMISELADDLEGIGHTGKNIFEWFIDEAILRGKRDFLLFDVASALQMYADEHAK